MPQAIHFVCRHVEILATDEPPPFWKSAREPYACALAWTWRFQPSGSGTRMLSRAAILFCWWIPNIFALRWKNFISKQKLTGCCSQSISLGRMKMIFTVVLMITIQLLTPRWDQTLACIWFFCTSIQCGYLLKLMLFSAYIRKSLNLIDSSLPVFIKLKLTREVFFYCR